jgi:hypothetical protein
MVARARDNSVLDHLRVCMLLPPPPPTPALSSFQEVQLCSNQIISHTTLAATTTNLNTNPKHAAADVASPSPLIIDPLYHFLHSTLHCCLGSQLAEQLINYKLQQS